MRSSARKLVAAAILILPALAVSETAAMCADRPRTFANPINIEYRFQRGQPSRREAVDPVIVLYGDDYYLFALASGGYWYSPDMIEWTFVSPGDRAFDAYAPALMIYDGALYYVPANGGLLRTKDPKSGKWENLGRPFSGGDPSLLADDGGRGARGFGGPVGSSATPNASPARFVICCGPSEYVFVGCPMSVTFTPNTPGSGTTLLASFDEGMCVDGRWVSGRRLNGDETGHNTRWPAMRSFGIYRYRVYQQQSK